MLIYLSYLRAFRKYANSLLNKSTSFAQLSKYANLLTERVALLMKRAGANIKLNVVSLQTDMYIAGVVYVKKFVRKHGNVKDRVVNHYPPPKCDLPGNSINDLT